ncbi:MAG: helix-turn-helix transcriptional regulator [Myxococcota bacterium]
MKGTKSDRELLRTRVKDALGDRTQKQLEQTLEVSGGTLSRVFGGRRNVDADFLRALADALDVEVHRLLHGTDFLLLFDDEELPREAGEVDVVAPLPPAPSEGPAPVDSLPSRGGPAADAVPEAAAEEPEVASEPEPELEAIPPSEVVTEPTMTVVDPPEPEPEPASSSKPSDETDTVTVDDATPSERPGLGGRIRRFIARMFGG